MKRDTGWTAALLVAVASFGLSSTGSRPDGGLQAVQPAVHRAQATKKGSGHPDTNQPVFQEQVCGDLEDQLRNFFNWPANHEKVAPKSCFDKAAPDSHASSVGDPQFIIATLADPLHTHLSLNFDRNADAIQQAALDAGYVFNSSWLPWQTEEDQYQLLSDQDVAEDRRDKREDQPGILLFRRKTIVGYGSPDHPFQDGLIVFIVGEEPTTGIHRAQFENAVQWIKSLRPADSKQPVELLGPSFSGSFPSLAELLTKSETDVATLVTASTPVSSTPSSDTAADVPHLRIYSGQITNSGAAAWFSDASRTDPLSRLHIQFHSFQQRETVTLQRYCDFLQKEDPDKWRLAVISEDETAYGADFTQNRTSTANPCEFVPPHVPAPILKARLPGYCQRPDLDYPCRKPMYLFYPRDMSALRAAYQQQSLFNRSTSSDPSQTLRQTLRTQLADPEGKQHDSIVAYGGDQKALAEEAVLQQIVKTLRAHQIQFMLVRSSNPLDYLFLSHYIKTSYPEGRVVIVASDLLLQREAGANGLNGIMALSTYPLLPLAEDWMKAAETPPYWPHLHHAFGQMNVEGNYIAMRFLLDGRNKLVETEIQGSDGNQKDSSKTADALAAPASTAPTVDQLFLPAYKADTEFTLPDYGTPFWLRATQPAKPLTWISVLGNNGFWPVASLGDQVDDQDPRANAKVCPSADPKLAPEKNVVCENPKEIKSTGRQPMDVPLSMDITLLAFFLFACGHTFCCLLPSVTIKPEHRAYFVRLRIWHSTPSDELVPFKHSSSHTVLIVAGSVFLASTATILCWGYGWMSPNALRISSPSIHTLYPIAIWCMCAFAVYMNALVENSITKGDQLLHWPYTKLCDLKELIDKTREQQDWKPRILWKSIRELLEPELRSLLPLTAYAFGLWLFYWIIHFFIDSVLSEGTRNLTYIRSMQLTTGVSPVVPILLLALGMYGWSWYSLRGLALLGIDKPLLPDNDDLAIVRREGNRDLLLPMLSREHMQEPLEEFCWPFNWQTWTCALLLFMVLCGSARVIQSDAPIRSLGTQRYSYLISFWVAISASVLLANAWQLMHIWLKLRAMLVYIDKLPLRRTMLNIRGFTWGSIWKMGGNILDLRYKLVFRQFESLNHLRTTLKDPKDLDKLREAGPDALAELEQTSVIETCIAKIDATRKTRLEFSRWYATNWNEWKARDVESLMEVQKQAAHTAGFILTHFLVPFWREEKHSLLDLASTPAESGTSADSDSASQPPGKDYVPICVRNAEELVCLIYLGFIQNTIGRIRTLVAGMIALFLSIAFVVPSYPFDPRPVLTAVVVGIATLTGLVVFNVYAQMFRDSTLSRLTNTRPGELGLDFWLKFASFGVGPALGLIATLFPDINNFFFSWLQPGLANLK